MKALASRPPRRMRPASAVADYHLEQGTTPDGAWPACFACHEGADRWSDLERAHLVDRCSGGLDGPQNLVMLCSGCHGRMPSFYPGDEAAAWAWVRTRRHWTDELGHAAHLIEEGLSPKAARSAAAVTSYEDADQAADALRAAAVEVPEREAAG